MVPLVSLDEVEEGGIAQFELRVFQKGRAHDIVPGFLDFLSTIPLVK